MTIIANDVLLRSFLFIQELQNGFGVTFKNLFAEVRLFLGWQPRGMLIQLHESPWNSVFSVSFLFSV